ncbi:hypothetical protein C4K24_0871 [Pseudomonas chlororaphis subsp. aurantiaca]|nr:hypothetical protein C4K24_0871 [Pseudomonas chlororaphis subsp. aurantiaca]
MASVLALHFLDGVHIRFCGNGGLWFRPYGESRFVGFCRSGRSTLDCPRWLPCWRCIFWMVYISIPAVTATYGSALTAGHFFSNAGMPAQQKVTKKRLPLRTAFAALRFPRSGVHQGASTPVGFASTSIRCPRLRRGALRAIPLMNTGTKPPDGAGGSKAKAKRDLPVGAKPCSRCRACEAAIDREAGAGGLRPLEDLRSYRSLRQRLQGPYVSGPADDSFVV